MKDRKFSNYHNQDSIHLRNVVLNYTSKRVHQLTMYLELNRFCVMQDFNIFFLKEKLRNTLLVDSLYEK